MSQEQIKQVFTTPDGKTFDSKAEALDYLRKPKIIEALNGITNSNVELSEWLYEKQELLEDIFASGTVRRVTKAEAKALEKALEIVKTLAPDNKGLEFIADNAGAIKESFKWPTVKKMEDSEKAKLINNSLLAATDNRQDLVDWITASKEKIFEAYEAGKVKREVSQKATDALAAYREKMALQKRLKEANVAFPEEATNEELQALVDALPAAPAE